MSTECLDSAQAEVRLPDGPARPETVLDAALQYAAWGWAVLPLHSIKDGKCTCGRADCPSPGKHPRTPHGSKDATVAEETIRRWWRLWPDANIGVATGAISNLGVIDIDPRHGGAESIDELVRAHGNLPPTFTVATGGGGLHLYFQLSGGKVPNSASKIAPGIDVRGEGGFVVAPPSVHASGKRYERVPGSPEDLATLPEWFWELAVAKPERPSPAEGPAPKPANGSSGDYWLGQALTRATDGNRNDTGLWLACQLRDNGLSQAEAEAVMLQYASRCPAGQVPYTDREAIATCRSVYSSTPRDPAQSQKRVGPPPKPESSPPPAPLSAGELLVRYPEMRKPVIEGLLREGEIMNVIAASKVGKSWLVLCLVLCLAIGRMFLGRFPVRQCNVLLIDNELHPETLARRLKTVAEAMGILSDEYATRLHIMSLRGRLQDLYSLGRFLDQIEPGRYGLIVLDAFYRFLPAGTDENDNGAMANLYNVLDAHAQRLGCAFVLIHHASKGSQSDKSVTDVGAGAGSMARATDTHLILRPHEEDHVVVLDAAARSWPPLNALCLRWKFPLWCPDETLDPTKLRRPSRRRSAERKTAEPKELVPQLTPDLFAAKYVKPTPEDGKVIIARAKLDGVSGRTAEDLLRLAAANGCAHAWPRPSRSEPQRYASKPAPEPDLLSCVRARTPPPHPPRVRKRTSGPG